MTTDGTGQGVIRSDIGIGIEPNTNPGWTPSPDLGDTDAYFENATPEHPKVEGRVLRTKSGLAGRRRVALVGFSEPAKVGVPYDDESWELWSLNQHYRHQPRATRWFEVHTRKQYLSDTVPDTDYLQWLRTCPIPVYVTEVHPDMPTAVPIPRQAILDVGACVWEERHGRYEQKDYTQSSLVLMLMVAMLEGFDQIGIWGVDLIVGTEYFYQKPNMEWFLGFCQGRGYTVTRGAARNVPREIVIPEASALLRQTYSYGPQTSHSNVLRPLMQDRQRALYTANNELVEVLNKMDGELHANFQWIKVLETHARGETVKWTNPDESVVDVPPGPEALLTLLRQRQQHVLDYKAKHLETLHSADGEAKDVAQWLNILDLLERGAAATWRFTDGRVERVRPD